MATVMLKNVNKGMKCHCVVNKKAPLFTFYWLSWVNKYLLSKCVFALKLIFTKIWEPPNTRKKLKLGWNFGGKQLFPLSLFLFWQLMEKCHATRVINMLSLSCYSLLWSISVCKWIISITPLVGTVNSFDTRIILIRILNLVINNNCGKICSLSGYANLS